MAGGHARRVPLAKVDQDVNQAVASLVNHGVLAVHRKRGGEITALKLVNYGWVSVATYGKIQMLRDAQPYILEIIKGGYQLKAWLWNTGVSIDILASGITIPFGLVEVITAVGLAAIDAYNGNQLYAYLDLLALVLPWGELWLLWRGYQQFLIWFGLAPGSGNGIGEVNTVLFGPVEGGLINLIEGIDLDIGAILTGIPAPAQQQEVKGRPIRPEK